MAIRRKLESILIKPAANEGFVYYVKWEPYSEEVPGGHTFSPSIQETYVAINDDDLFDKIHELIQ